MYSKYVSATYIKELLILLQMNYKLFNAARDKSTMNYQEGRFDMELELNIDIDSSTDRCRNLGLTNCPRHSHNECVKPANLPDIHLRNTTASTVSHTFLFYYKFP